MGKHRVMIPCDEATRLLSEAQDRSLGAGERTVLRMHTWICSGCRQFGAQVGFIRQAMKGFADRNDGHENDDGGGDGSGDGDRRGPPGRDPS
ncbi:zf-HC2 domain-containing protein [Aquabacterium sp.]|uniref:zf-HC2 domain-containing protein n=1 Tax=Aquabacterium sp. TaxID=1872578 RepID=UPI0025C705B2|nr:zf-HC2 domain-containing protein [Aquabacterium sp.]